MKKFLIFGLIAITLIIGAYFIITRNGLPIININNIKSVNITKGLVPMRKLNIDDNRTEIENLIAMYNKAKRYYREGDTTPEINIVFQLRAGKEISIQGNTQTYQYVYVNGKHYKIAGKDLTSYIRGLCKESSNSK